jgi:hypothetical protein
MYVCEMQICCYNNVKYFARIKFHIYKPFLWNFWNFNLSASFCVFFVAIGVAKLHLAPSVVWQHLENLSLSSGLFVFTYILEISPSYIWCQV